MKRSELTAFDSHLEFCIRKVHKSAVRYPWELGFLGGPNTAKDVPKPVGAVPMLPPSTTGSSGPRGEDVGDSLAVRTCRKLLCRQPLIEWEQKRVAQRDAILKKWLAIVLRDPMYFDVSRSILASLSRGFHTSTLKETLSSIFAQKSSATLQSRVGPMLRYVYFCNRVGRTPFPIDEPVVFEYMLDEATTAAPTYLRSFLGSLAFCFHVLGLAGADLALKSARVRGLAAENFLKKRKTMRKMPLRRAELLRLEEIVLGETDHSIFDRHAAGCFLFMAYARARFSDMMNVTSLKLDVVKLGGGPGFAQGFIETEVGRSKTSFSLERKVQHLPMTATVAGVHEKPWGISWNSIVVEAGVTVGAGKPLLPARTQTGWHSLPLSAESGTIWLRSLLQGAEGFDAGRSAQMGTHSLKATCLSWMAKWGVSDDTRRLMGYHVGEKRSTMLVYGRDNTSAGLRVLQTIIDAVKLRTFLPDATRSGMFTPSHGAGNPCGSALEDQCLSSSSEDSADEDQPQHEEVERAEAEVVGSWNAGIRVDKIPPRARFFRHEISRMIHLTKGRSGEKLMCGRSLGDSYLSLAHRPPFLNPVCKQCFSRFM